MKAKNVIVGAASAAALFVSGRAIYQLSEDRVKQYLADRRERDLQKTIAELQKKLDKDAMKMVIRFEVPK